MSSFTIITRDKNSSLKGHTTRMTTSDTAREVRDELVRRQYEPGTTITVVVR